MTLHNCHNPDCRGIRIFERVFPGMNGNLIELYRCTRCHAVSHEKARTLALLDDDADTERITPVVVDRE